MKKSVPWNLIIPKLKQEISADEERQLETWLRSSNNEALFKELQLLWEKIQANVENYTPNTEYYWNELVNRMHASEPKQTAKPAKKRFELKQIYRYAVAACIAVAIGCSFYIGFLNGQPEAMPQLYSNLSGKSKVLLPDGSEVWMHTETSLQYESQMNKDERIVNVTGEAYFDVAHDADKPFIVQTEGMRIVVHGTKFNVDAFPGSENTLVSLVEGSVSSWANTQLVFRNRSLGDICKLLSKWYRVKIDVDPTLSNKYFYTFTLRSEPLDEILRIMARIQPMKYTFNEENELTISFADTKQKVK